MSLTPYVVPVALTGGNSPTISTTISPIVVSGTSVGIGTNAPTSRLQVAGVVTATGFVGPVTGNVTGNVSGTSSGVTGVTSVVNGGTGSTANANSANGVVILNGSGKLPAVDGSQLTNLSIVTPNGTSSQLLANSGSSGFANVTVGNGLTYSSNTLSLTSGTSLGSSWSAGTPYHNTYGVPMFVSWTLNGQGDGSGSSAHSYIGSTSGAINIATGGQDLFFAGGASQQGVSVWTFYVPVGWYWTINNEGRGSVGTIQAFTI